MAAAALRRYSSALSTTSATTVLTVPTARALVVGKLLIAASGTSTITITCGGAIIVSGLSLAAGQVYTETNLVLLAGETLTAQAGTANFLNVSIFGEEVDN